MGTFLKYLLQLLANIIWQSIGGGKGAIPPVRLPKSKKPVNIPVVSPWQTFVVMWVAKRAWAAFGSQLKDKLASSPHEAAQQVGSWLPKAPAKPKPKSAAPKPGAAQAPAPAPAPRPPQTWTSTAQPAAPTPSKATPPPAPTQAAAYQAAPQPAPSAPRVAANYATHRLDDAGAAPAPAPQAPPAAAPATPPVASAPQPAPTDPPAPAIPVAPQPTGLRVGSLLASLRKRA